MIGIGDTALPVIKSNIFMRNIGWAVLEHCKPTQMQIVQEVWVTSTAAAVRHGHDTTNVLGRPLEESGAHCKQYLLKMVRKSLAVHFSRHMTIKKKARLLLYRIACFLRSREKSFENDRVLSFWQSRNNESPFDDDGGLSFRRSNARK